MGNLSLIFIFVVVCLLGTVSTLNTTKTIDLYSPAATGVESRQFYNGNNLQLHFPNLIALVVMLFTRCYEFFFGSTETTTATTTTTTTTTTTQKLTCELLGGMTCAAITAAPNCITLVNDVATPQADFASACAQTGSGMGAFHIETDGTLDGTAVDAGPLAGFPNEALLRCFLGDPVPDVATINVGLMSDPTMCILITTSATGTMVELAAAAPCANMVSGFVCSVAVPP